MSSKVVLVFCVLVTVAAVSAQGWGGPAAGNAANPWVSQWVASNPWFPKWVPCTTVGSSCVDCNTKLVCSKFGGLQRACNSPLLPYCNLGECSATPADGCPIVPTPY